jgi:hypothetical protein
VVDHSRLRRDAAQSKPEQNAKRRTLRTLLMLLVALAATYWAGREFGLHNDELLGYLLASVGLVVASGVVALLWFGLVRLFRR